MKSIVTENEKDFFVKLESFGEKIIIKPFPAIKEVNGVERVSKEDVLPRGEVLISNVENIKVGDVVGFSFGMLSPMNHLFISEMEKESSGGRYLWLGGNHVLYKFK